MAGSQSKCGVSLYEYILGSPVKVAAVYILIHMRAVDLFYAITAKMGIFDGLDLSTYQCYEKLVRKIL